MHGPVFINDKMTFPNDHTADEAEQMMTIGPFLIQLQLSRQDIVDFQAP